MSCLQQQHGGTSDSGNTSNVLGSTVSVSWDWSNSTVTEGAGQGRLSSDSGNVTVGGGGDWVRGDGDGGLLVLGGRRRRRSGRGRRGGGGGGGGSQWTVGGVRSDNTLNSLSDNGWAPGLNRGSTLVLGTRGDGNQSRGVASRVSSRGGVVRWGSKSSGSKSSSGDDGGLHFNECSSWYLLIKC